MFNHTWDAWCRSMAREKVDFPKVNQVQAKIRLLNEKKRGLDNEALFPEITAYGVRD